MVFNNLIKLNSVVAEGFLLNKIISTIKTDNPKISENEKETLNKAKEYLDMVQKGKEFISKEKVVKNFENSLKAYLTTIKALRQSEKKLNTEKLNEILRDSRNQISIALEKESINNDELKTALTFFKSIRYIILEQASELSNQESNLFI